MGAAEDGTDAPLKVGVTTSARIEAESKIIYLALASWYASSTSELTA